MCDVVIRENQIVLAVALVLFLVPFIDFTCRLRMRQKLVKV